MGIFLSYSIIGGFLMLALYLTYRLFLARDNQHGFNRSILLLIYLVSFSVPSFPFSLGSTVGNANLPTFFREGSEVAGTAMPVDSQPLWGTVLI